MHESSQVYLLFSFHANKGKKKKEQKYNEYFQSHKTIGLILGEVMQMSEMFYLACWPLEFFISHSLDTVYRVKK